MDVREQKVFNKSLELAPNSFIRLSIDVDSYWVFNVDGVIYVGRMLNESMNKAFYHDEKEYILSDNKGDYAKIQPLKV